MRQHIDTIARRRHLKQVAAVQAVCGEDAYALAQESPTALLRCSRHIDKRVGRSAVDNKHTGINTLPDKGVQKPPAGNRRTSMGISSVENHHFHLRPLRSIAPMLRCSFLTIIMANTQSIAVLTTSCSIVLPTFRYSATK